MEGPESSREKAQKAQKYGFTGGQKNHDDGINRRCRLLSLRASKQSAFMSFLFGFANPLIPALDLCFFAPFCGIPSFVVFFLGYSSSLNVRTSFAVP
jgi:hypothetical protein